MQPLKKRPANPERALRARTPLDKLLDPNLFMALSDPTRVRLLSCVAKCGRWCTVGEIAECSTAHLSMVSRHLSALAEAGVLDTHRHGRNVAYRVRFGALADVFRSLAGALDDCFPEGRQHAVLPPDPRGPGLPRVVFISSGCSCRSPMAVGFCRLLYTHRIEAFAAGHAPTIGLDPSAVAVMKEVGIDLRAGARSRVQEFWRKDSQLVVTMSESVRREYPAFPGAARLIHYGVEDPARAGSSAPNPLESLAHYRRVRDQIMAFVVTLPKLLAPCAPGDTAPARHDR